MSTRLGNGNNATSAALKELREELKASEEKAGPRVKFVRFFTLSPRKLKRVMIVIMVDGSRYRFGEGRMASAVKKQGICFELLQQIAEEAYRSVLELKVADGYLVAQRLLSELQDVLEGMCPTDS